MAQQATHNTPEGQFVFLESGSSGILGNQGKRGNTIKSVYVYTYTPPSTHIVYKIQGLCFWKVCISNSPGLN